MAEAALRRCPNKRCRKPYERCDQEFARFLSLSALTREEGCNHIKCPCGTHSGSLGAQLAAASQLRAAGKAAISAAKSWTKRGPTTTTRRSLCHGAATVTKSKTVPLLQDGHLGGGKNDDSSKCIVCGSQCLLPSYTAACYVREHSKLKRQSSEGPFGLKKHLDPDLPCTGQLSCPNLPPSRVCHLGCTEWHHVRRRDGQRWLLHHVRWHA